MARGNWWAALHGVAQSWSRLKQLSMHACIEKADVAKCKYWVNIDKRYLGILYNFLNSVFL